MSRDVAPLKGGMSVLRIAQAEHDKGACPFQHGAYMDPVHLLEVWCAHLGTRVHLKVQE